jgi:hypothetical protein
MKYSNMKTLLKLLGIILVMILFIASCRKTGFDTQYKNDETFNAAAVKEWYYAVFKKSAEWQSSPEHGKKLPKWNYPTYRKVGNLEIIEFPLARIQNKIYITKNAATTDADRKRIAESSLETISFIKTSDNRIFVRELEYVPTWDFLKANNFDISKNILAKNNDFTGRITIKKWSGETVNIRKFKDGMSIGTYKLEKQTNNTQTESDPLPNCTYQIMCTYESDCTTITTGDNVITFCEWVLVSCDFDNPVLISCDDDGSQCDPSSSESCECQLLGIGCGDPDPDPDPDPDDPGVDVNSAKEYTIYNSFGGPSPNNIWKIVGHATVSGKRFSNGDLNFFTNCSPDYAEFISTNLTITHWNLSGWYAIFTDVGGTGTTLENDKKAKVTHATTVSYPNQGNEFHSYAGLHIWFAFSDL